jgi:Do/DeqQ family serine protease
MRAFVLGLVAFVFGATAAEAQALRVTPMSEPQVQLSFAPVVKRAKPAVVNVNGSQGNRRPADTAMMDDFFKRFFGESGPAPSMPQERVLRSVGSGVIVDPAGLVITNHHVIENLTEVRVALTDRREFEADIILRDPRTDLAVLRIKAPGPFPTMEFGDSEGLEIGDLVLAIGNPFGIGQTVTQGIISALARTQVGIGDFQFFIQTDAAINPGNSGGALVDMSGRLVGINTAIFSRSGGSHGVGFAIPSSMARVVLASARDGHSTVRRPWLGARLQTLTPDLAESMGLTSPVGVVVASVTERGPAEGAGLRRGDIVLALDGIDLESAEAFNYRFALRGVGGHASILVSRNNRREMVRVPLQSAPETRPRDPVRINIARSPLAGLTVVNLSPAVADELQLDSASDGVVISAVEQNSAAARAGFRRGDVFVALNGTRIQTSRDFERVQRSQNNTWDVTINRGGRTISERLAGT